MMNLTTASRGLAAAAALTAAALVGMSGCGKAPPLPRPSDLLLVVIDCLRADHVGTYGYERATTPHLDRLAAEGVTFTRAFSQSHWTRGSVPSLLSGLYPSEHGLLTVDRNRRGEVIGPALSDGVELVSEPLQAAGFATALIGEQYQLSRNFNFNQGFDFYLNQTDGAANVNRNYLRWLGAQEEGRPTFVYLHYLDLHWPYCPRDWAKGMFSSGDNDFDPCHDWRRLRREVRDGSRQLSPQEVAQLVSNYDEELVQTDEFVGQLFDRLRETGRWDEMLVVVTSDHGEEFMERGLLGHQEGLVDRLLHVPLIVKPPLSWGIEGGGRDDGLVELRAVAPTLRVAVGLEPGRGAPDLIARLRGTASSDDVATVFAENSTMVAARTDSHKLVVWREGGRRELFDLAADPGELSDRLTEQPQVAAELAARLRSWRRSLAPIATREAAVGEETTEGLRDLGYID